MGVLANSLNPSDLLMHFLLGCLVLGRYVAIYLKNIFYKKLLSAYQTDMGRING